MNPLCRPVRPLEVMYITQASRGMGYEVLTFQANFNRLELCAGLRCTCEHVPLKGLFYSDYFFLEIKISTAYTLILDLFQNSLFQANGISKEVY